MAQSNDFFSKTKRGRGRVKHAILKYYLGSYFAILGQSDEIAKVSPRIIYIDGFAGTGQYIAENGSVEEGSPIIAYKTVVEHQFYKNFKCEEILMIFIEMVEEKQKQLFDNLTAIQKDYPNRGKVKFLVFRGEFEEVMFDLLAEEDYSSDPMLIFADPFGIKGIPMDLIKQLVYRPAITEILINIMFSSINHWYGNQRLNKTFNKLLGETDSKWKTTVFNDQIPKSDAFIKFYVGKLASPYSYTHIFAMKDKRNRNVYQLVFLTNHMNGVMNMKRAMANSSQQTNRFVYSEWLESKIEQGKELMLITPHKNLADIKQLIFEEYQGECVEGHKIERFIWCDTPYIFNVKNELKKDFKDYIVVKNRSFNEIVFKIPEEVEIL